MLLLYFFEKYNPSENEISDKRSKIPSCLSPLATFLTNGSDIIEIY